MSCTFVLLIDWCFLQLQCLVSRAQIIDKDVLVCSSVCRHTSNKSNVDLEHFYLCILTPQEHLTYQYSHLKSEITHRVQIKQGRNLFYESVLLTFLLSRRHPQLAVFSFSTTHTTSQKPLSNAAENKSELSMVKKKLGQIHAQITQLLLLSTNVSANQ